MLLRLLVIVCVCLTACAPPWASQGPAAGARAQGVQTLPPVTLNVSPEDGSQWLLDRVASARTRAYLKLYLLTDLRIVDALTLARKRGADVRVILEDDVYGSDDRTRIAAARLADADIPTRTPNPTVRLSHEKSALIDDLIVIQTANMTASAWSRNREFFVTSTDPQQVREVASVFLADWGRTRTDTGVGSLVWSPDGGRARLEGLVRSANRSLDVYAEVVQDKGLVALLAERAQSAVQVRLLVSPTSDGKPGPNDPGLDELQRGGVRVRYLRQPYVHAKAFLADGTTAYVGSHNISYSSLDLNRELGVMFDTPAAIERLRQTFELDWARAADR